MPRSLRLLAGPLVVAVVVMLGGAAMALACSCLVATEAEQAARASALFAGTAVASSDPNAGGPLIGSGDPIEWTFAVDTVVKGEVVADQRVTTARDGASCGASFEVGRRYLVFASDGESGGLVTGVCSGTRPFGADEPVPDLGRRGLSTAQAAAFDRFPVYWLDISFAGQRITSIVRERGRLTFSYGPFSVQTTRKCASDPARRIAPPTDRRRLRGVPAGVRGGDLVLFSGREEIRIAGPRRLRGRAVATLRAANPPLTTVAAGDPLPRPARGLLTMADCATLIPDLPASAG